MRRYPPDATTLFLLGWTQPEAVPEPAGLRIRFKPFGRIAPFWRAFILFGMVGLAGALTFDTSHPLEALYPLAAILFLMGLLLAEYLVPWRGEARIGRGAVEVARHDLLGRGAWQEPLAAYRGLRPFGERWVEVEQPATQADYERNQRVGRPPRKHARARGWLFLEHRTDPRRSIPVARIEDAGLPVPEAQELAAHIGLPLLEPLELDRG